MWVEAKGSKFGEGVDDLDIMSANQNKAGGKMSITVMPLKRVMVVKPERFKRKKNVWSKDCFLPPDSWSSQEDAMLCAIVHEYGTHWTLASDAIYSMPGGGFYRGWFRHPIHCCERFRELVLKYVLPTADSSNTEKSTVSGSEKALLKVTEDQARTSLNVMTELPDTELHLQKHFLAVLSSVWKAKCCIEGHQSKLPFRNGLSSRLSGKKSVALTENMDSRGLKQSSKLVLAALLSDVSENHKEPSPVPTQLQAQTSADQVDITLDFLTNQIGYETDFPSSITLSMNEPEPSVRANESHRESLLAESSCRIAENRHRLASEACFDGEGSGWASSAFPLCNTARNRSGGKPPVLGKHKSFSDSSRKSKVQRTAESYKELGLHVKFLLPSPRPSTEFNDFPPIILDYRSDYHSQLPFMDPPPEIPSLEFIPEDYDQDFFTGLEDLGSLQDVTDVG